MPVPIALLSLAPTLLVSGAAPARDAGARDEQARPPNILVVVADDMGTDLLSAYEPYYPGTPTDPPPPLTPAIDWLIEGGMLFTDCWASPSCSPARAQILTGRHAHRTGIGGQLIENSGEPGLQLNETTLPQILRRVQPGYFSAAVGKWHLAATNERSDWVHALGPSESPWFDLWAGSLFNLRSGRGTDYNSWVKTFATAIHPGVDECEGERLPGQLVLDAKTSRGPSPSEYATVDTIDDAVHLVGELPEPWFLYVAFNAPHIPLTDPDAPLARSECLGFQTLPYCSAPVADRALKARCMVRRMDSELGRLLCDVESEGLTERTVVLFIGDNGTIGPSRASGTLRDGAIVPPFVPDHGKGSVYQGGVNVPLVVRGPGVAHGVCEELVSATDFVATIAELAGHRAPNELAADSVSFVPQLRNGAAPGRKTVYAEKFDPNFVPVAGGAAGAGGPSSDFAPRHHFRALRSATHKLIRIERRAGSGEVEVHEELYELRRPERGKPQVDPYELEDLRPDVVPGGPSALDRTYDALLAEMQAQHPSLL